jgi:hypothetical protein
MVLLRMSCLALNPLLMRVMHVAGYAALDTAILDVLGANTSNDIDGLAKRIVASSVRGESKDSAPMAGAHPCASAQQLQLNAEDEFELFFAKARQSLHIGENAAGSLQARRTTARANNTKSGSDGALSAARKHSALEESALVGGANRNKRDDTTAGAVAGDEVDDETRIHDGTAGAAPARAVDGDSDVEEGDERLLDEMLDDLPPDERAALRRARNPLHVNSIVQACLPKEVVPTHKRIFCHCLNSVLSDSARKKKKKATKTKL